MLRASDEKIHVQGTSQAKISKIFKVSRGMVQDVIKENIKRGHIKDRKKSESQQK